MIRSLEFYSDERDLFSLNIAVTMNPMLIIIMPHSGSVGMSSGLTLVATKFGVTVALLFDAV